MPVGLIYNINKKKFYCIEPYIEGAYKKYNSDHGYISQNDQVASLFAQSFSDFTYQDSKQQILVIDIHCMN